MKSRPHSSPSRAFRRIAAITLAVFILQTCATAAEKQSAISQESANALTKQELAAFRTEVAKNYPAYKRLKVQFTLKGKIDSQELFYEGEISATEKNLQILLKDAVFLSPLLSVNFGADTVIVKDIARNKTQRLVREEYSWVELFGRSFPVRFFEPMMRGFLPQDATAAESTYERTSAGEILVRSRTDNFEAALYFSGGVLTKLFYRDKTRGEILVFNLASPFKERNYPKTLSIELTRSTDFLKLNFKGLRVTKLKAK